MRKFLLAALAVLALSASACLPIPSPVPGPGPEPGPAPGPAGRATVARVSADLAGRAEILARSCFDRLKGRGGRIAEAEQAALYRTEEFAAAARLFARLAGESEDFFGPESLQTNLYGAFLYLAASFRQLDADPAVRRLDLLGLEDGRRLVDRLEREFRSWPEEAGQAALEGKYVKARDATVYLVVRESAGRAVRRPFKNLESLFRYNYDQKRGQNPWDHFVEISEETLRKMPRGRMIELSFDGRMVMERDARPGSPVYLVEGGLKRPLSRVELVSRFGGWGKVFELPRDILDGYADGEPIR
jgi:hypothetical protein